MGYTSSEVKSGFFIIVTIALLLALTFIVGGFMGGESNLWQVRFGYLNGLESSAPVYFAGREVGKVEAIEIQNEEERPVLVTVKVTDEVFLRIDSESFIDTLGMMGEKFVELTPGTFESPALAPGTIIQGTDPIPMHVMIRKMNILADQMEAMSGSLEPILKNVDTLLADSKEDIAKTIANFEQSSSNVRDMTRDLKFRPWRLVRRD